MASEISRRTLLARSGLVVAVGAGIGLGFTRTVHHKHAVPPPPPPAALTAALTTQQALLASYHNLAGTAGLPGAFPALQSDVGAHGDAIRGLLDNYPGWRLAQAQASSGARTDASGTTQGDAPTPSGPDAGTSATAAPPADSIASLASQTKSAAAELTTAATGWPATEAHAQQVIPVLGSIAACLRTHLQVLG
jgi:hypothetical protein